MEQNLRCGTPVPCWFLQLDRGDVFPNVFNCCPRELNLFEAIGREPHSAGANAVEEVVDRAAMG
jgi:hypothetical protein